MKADMFMFYSLQQMLNKYYLNSPVKKYSVQQMQEKEVFSLTNNQTKEINEMPSLDH